jgi:hypothetical protein
VLPGCRSVQLDVTEAGGELSRLAPSVRAHLEACAACAEVAAAERTLAGLLALALPAADPGLAATTAAALPGAPWRRRLLTLLPVAASLAVAALGAGLAGGVPGSDLLALLPAWSSGGWLALAGTASDLGVAAVATARAAGSAMPAAAASLAALLSACGLAGILAWVRGWRRSPAWRGID